MSKPFDVVSIGAAIQDLFLHFPGDQIPKKSDTQGEFLRVPFAEKLVANSAYYAIGGGAANTAKACDLMGLRSAVIVAVGKDEFAGHILANFHAAGIDTRAVQTVQQPTGLSLIIATKGNDRTAVLYRGANDYVDLAQPTAQETMRQARWLLVSHVSGHGHTSLGAMADILSTDSSIRLAWNPGSTQIERGLTALAPVLKHTEILTLNRSEAKKLTRRKEDAGTTLPQQMHGVAQHLLAAGPRVVVITDGPNGAAAWTQKDCFVSGILPGVVVSTAGAGDAFFAAFTAGYDRSHGDLSTALSYGAANASGVVTQEGAQNGLRSMNEIREVLAQTPAFLVHPVKY